MTFLIDLFDNLSRIEIGLIGFAVLFFLLAIRTPVATAMLVVGLFGGIILTNPRAAMSTLGAETFVIATNFNLVVIPLFVLMGNIAGVSGMSRDLYDAAYAWVGHWRGGLASSTIVGCAGFAALSGSSLASAVTMGRVSLPQMQRYKYSDSLATGSIAAGGTLGILIPPSTGFVIYAILTDESIAQLFIAGIIPGLLLTGLFVLAIMILTTINPSLGPRGEKASFPLRFRTLGRAFWIIGIILLTIGGIYGGWFSIVEASAVGAFLAFIVAISRRAMGRSNLVLVLTQTVRTTATSFFILIGAHVFIPFVALTGIPGEIVRMIAEMDASPLAVLAVILVFYVILGTFLEGLAILILTLPIVVPIIEQMGFSLVWWGVIMVIVLEMGLISPPVGVNVFVVKGIAPEVPMNDIFKGILPFWVAMAVAIAMLVAWPELAMYLPCQAFDLTIPGLHFCGGP